MAKMNGLVGGLSGKMGNAVFRQRSGQQIVAQYQPIVRNPRSGAQSEQRARFKLMSQLAAVVADGLGGTMSVLARPERRGASPRNNFVRENFAKSAAVTVDNEITATIDLIEVQLTKSARPLGSITLDTTQSSDMVKASIESIPSNVTKVRIVALGYATNGAPVLIHNELHNVDISDNTVVAEIDIPSFAAQKKAVVMAYGVIPLTSKASQDLDNITLENSDVKLTLVQNILDGSMAETVTIAAEAVWQA